MYARYVFPREELLVMNTPQPTIMYIQGVHNMHMYAYVMSYALAGTTDKCLNKLICIYKDTYCHNKAPQWQIKFYMHMSPL